MLPWKELLEETAKPRVFYSIPSVVPVAGPSLSLLEKLNEMTMKVIYPSIADQIFKPSELYLTLIEGNTSWKGEPLLTPDNTLGEWVEEKYIRTRLP